MDKVLNGLRELTNAQSSLDRENYDTAFSNAKLAKSTFETVLENINDPEAYPPAGRVDQSFINHVEQWESEANEVQLNAAAEQQSD